MEKDLAYAQEHGEIKNPMHILCRIHKQTYSILTSNTAKQLDIQLYLFSFPHYFQNIQFHVVFQQFWLLHAVVQHSVNTTLCISHGHHPICALSITLSLTVSSTSLNLLSQNLQAFSFPCFSLMGFFYIILYPHLSFLLCFYIKITLNIVLLSHPLLPFSSLNLFLNQSN